MAEKVLKVGMDREDGFLYYIDKDGDIARVQMSRGGTNRKYDDTCKWTNCRSAHKRCQHKRNKIQPSNVCVFRQKMGRVWASG